jgi:hypothetical protein
MPASVKTNLCLLALCLLGAGQHPAHAFPVDLFGYAQEPQQQLADFPSGCASSSGICATICRTVTAAHG